MPELLRPEPPRSLGERIAAARSVLHPARVAATVGLVLLLAVGGWWLVRPAPVPVEDGLPRAPVTPDGSSSSAGGGTLAAPPTLAPVVVVVQVAGAVAQPGVYRMADGSRVIDLIQAAGGALPDADLQAMALAGRLADGQRVQVPHQGEVLPAGMTGAPPSTLGDGVPGAPSAPVDLNQASVAELDALPGVGPATAQAIVAYRDKHGPFRAVDDLNEVQGIGPARLEALRDLVTV